MPIVTTGGRRIGGSGPTRVRAVRKTTTPPPPPAKTSPFDFGAGSYKQTLRSGKGGSSVGGFFRHLGGDISSAITGIPSTAVLAAKNAALPITLAVEKAGEHMGLGGRRSRVSKAAATYRKDVTAEDRAAVRAIVQDYKARYGPAVNSIIHGHPGAAAANLGRAFYQHPGFVAGDVATVWAALGLGARAGSAAADVAGVGRAGGALREAHKTSIVKGPRVRPSETLRHDIEGFGQLEHTVTRPPMSRNPLTRAVFQRPAAAAVRALHRRLADVETGPLSDFSTLGRISRGKAKEARLLAGQREAGISVANERAAAAARADMRRLRSYIDSGLRGHPHEMTALPYHLQYPGLTVTKARRIADAWEAEITKLEQAPGPRPRTTERRKNVEALRTLIDQHPDLLDEATAPERLRTAVGSFRRLGAYGQEIAHEAYGIPREKLQARAELPQRVNLGGQELVRDLRPEQGRLARANARLAYLSQRAPTASAKVAEQNAKAALRQANKDLRAAQRTGSIPKVEEARAAVAAAEAGYRDAAKRAMEIAAPARSEIAALSASRTATAATLPRPTAGRYQVPLKTKGKKRLEREATRLEREAKSLRAEWEPVFKPAAKEVRASKGGRFYPIGSKGHNAAYERSQKIKRQQKKGKGSGMARFTRPNEGEGGVFDTVHEDLTVRGVEERARAAYERTKDVESRLAQVRAALQEHPEWLGEDLRPVFAGEGLASTRTVDMRARRARAAQESAPPVEAGPVAITKRGRQLEKRYFTPGEMPLSKRMKDVRTEAERAIETELVMAQRARTAAAAALEKAQKVGDQASIRAATRELTLASRAVRKSEANLAVARAGYRGTPKEIRAATRKQVVAQRALQREASRKEGRMRLTPPVDASFAPEPGAVYMKHVPADRLNKQQRGELLRKEGRFSPKEVHKSLGILIKSGNVVLDPRLVIQSVNEAHRVIGNRNSLRDLITVAAYRDHGILDPKTGLPVVAKGNEAYLRAAANPDHVALVDAGQLERTLRQGAAENPLDTGIFVGADEIAAIPKGARRRVIAINRKAAEEWQAGMRSSRGGPILEKYDRILGMWKSAVLALAPRWYIHNTVGNTLQFALLAGPRDVNAIRRASRNHDAIRQAILDVAPTLEQNFIQESMSLGLSRQAAGQLAHARYQALLEAAFRFNNGLEGLMRRAAYLAASKKVMRDEGVNLRMRSERLGGMSDEQIAQALRDMPTPAKAEALRLAERFLGDYSNFTRFERDVLKRIFPFYSWLRVISKLSVNLPVRHPLTAQFLAVTSQMSQPVENPWDPVLPYYQRGGIHIGPASFGSASTNPFATVAGMLNPLASGSGIGAWAADLAGASESPFLQLAANELTGVNQFTGRPFTAPPGYNDTVQLFGREPMRIDEQTGQPTAADRPTPGIGQSLWSLVPFAPMVRGGLVQAAGGRRPYDTTSDLELARYILSGGNPTDLFLPPPTRPRGIVNPPGWSQLASYMLGMPYQEVDPAAIAAQTALARRDYAEAAAATARARARNLARLGGP